jgi:uncharacterized protein YukE
MASILTHGNIADATAAIQAYVNTCNGIYQSLVSTMTTLTTSNWNGDGAEGCKEFLNKTVTPALTDGISSIAKALSDILSNVQETLLDQLDPQLGDGNRNPGGTQA